MNEAETRAEHIDPALKAAGWGVVDGSRVSPRARMVVVLFDLVSLSSGLIDRGSRLWGLWSKVGAVGNAWRCPRQADRCA